MHSTLRKELCGTPKIFQSGRSRSSSRFSIQRRRFSHRAYLLNQPGAKDHTATCSSDTSKPSEPPQDPVTGFNPPAREIGADLEKWIQVLSDKGHLQQEWDSISEKDASGKRKLLPHIKQELEKLSQHAGQDGNQPQTIGFEIHDGQIRPLTSSELAREHNSTTENSRDRKNPVLQNDGAANEIPASQLVHSSGELETSNTEQSAQEQPKDKESRQAQMNGSEASSQVYNGDIVSRFHGSSAARRRRERHSRLNENATTILPDWFSQQNVFLSGEPMLLPESNIRLKEPQGVLEWPTGWSNDENKHLDYDVAREEIPEAVVAEQAVEESIKEPANSTEEEPVIEKEQTFAPGSGSGSSTNPSLPANNNSGQSGSGTVDTEVSSPLFVIPQAMRSYYIQRAQREELILTARGRLRLPAKGTPSNKPGGIRSHILVHYTAQDGDIFLDRLIEDLARQLHSNLVTLDAQDISALISKDDIDAMMAEEAKTLSYDIYGDVYKDEIPEEEHPSMFPEDMEDMDDDGGSPGPQGIPFMVGKPITIDLKALFGPRSSRRDGNRSLMKNMMPEFLGRASIPKPVPHIFQSLVESILSTPSNKQRVAESEAVQQTTEDTIKDSPTRTAHQEATIVHVKDLKAIQDTTVGKHFLSQLYDQVERRRSNGEPIMMIGTSCERDHVSSYDTDRIKSLQVSEPDEISSTILITPAYQGPVTEKDSEQEIRYELQRNVIPKRDRARRIATINARHLYVMLQSKDIALDSLKEGFWTRDFPNQINQADREYLEKSFWSFSYVQRIAAILASSDFSSSPHPIADAAGMLEASDELKYRWAKSLVRERQKHNKKDKTTEEAEDDKLAQIRAKATKHEKRLLGGVIEPGKIATTFRDIHIPAETVEALQTLTTLSLVRPDAFKYGVLASDRIPGLLLYGPPGTGKTLAAKAVARESGATMLEVSAADINDMYVGEGEKNVKALFSLAKKLSPCVVFLDEADAMFSARSNAGRRVSHRELLNQFLKEWDGMSNDSGSAFIMVATNRPMDLDDAVLRRLPRRLLVDLPTEKDRLEILKIHLRHESLADDVDLASLASRTQFYSGSDLKNIAVAAALSCVREENALAKEHAGSEPYRYPEKRTLTSAHFDRALEEISASISEDMTSLRDIKKFDERYGDKKGRKRRSPKWGFKTAAEADAVLDTVKVRP